MNRVDKQLARAMALAAFDDGFRTGGAELVAGADEVGRGSLCGPVAAVCAVFRRGTLIPGVDDSKKLSAKRRAELFGLIAEAAADWAFVTIDSSVIDEINILQATRLAMSRAVNALKVKPDILLVDALTVPDISCAQRAVTGGDGKSFAIAAASILAKVSRDRLMDAYAEQLPGYGLERNKGYGTREHIRAIGELGLTVIHRKSFCGRFIHD